MGADWRERASVRDPRARCSFTKKEAPVLARFELTPAAPTNEMRSSRSCPCAVPTTCSQAFHSICRMRVAVRCCSWGKRA